MPSWRSEHMPASARRFAAVGPSRLRLDRGARWRALRRRAHWLQGGDGDNGATPKGSAEGTAVAPPHAPIRRRSAGAARAPPPQARSARERRGLLTTHEGRVPAVLAEVHERRSARRPAHRVHQAFGVPAGSGGDDDDDDGKTTTTVNEDETAWDRRNLRIVGILPVRHTRIMTSLSSWNTRPNGVDPWGVCGLNLVVFSYWKSTNVPLPEGGLRPI